ncbi:antirestriction protein ArdA [Ruminococcaceae bacterium OttesenSCG-928-L11]|nr:antirestriction protein ArdA [Ruminococcaceae bacterium OttesenSCG-928-L11]
MKVNVRATQYHQEEGYTGAELRLPASKSEIIDALDRARVPYGSGEYVAIPSMTTTPTCFIEPLINVACPPSLAELNHLAQRLEILEPYDQYILEGIAQHRPPRSAADLIDATHNTDKYSFYPYISTDKQLGEHAIENDILPEFSSMSREVQACLDLSKVGARLRQYEGGILTGDGYIVPESDEWVQMYDETLAQRAITWDERDPIISLEICKHSDDLESVWLHCPASQEDMERVLEAAHANIFDECIIRRVQSVITDLEYEIEFDQYISAVNGLASDIKAIGPENYAKYKAAYELEGVGDLDHARQLAQELDGYSFIPLSTTAEYGRALLEQSGMDVDLAAKYGFDFDAYARSRLNLTDARFTDYGILMPIQQQELRMEQETEQTLEPTIGGM